MTDTEQLKEKAKKEVDDNEFQQLFREGKTKEGIEKIASHIIKEHHIKSIYGERITEGFYYKEGIYVSAGGFIKERVEKLLGELSTSHYINETTEKIKRKTFVKRESFKDNNPNLLNLKNGILDIKKGECIEHNPKYKFFTQLPVLFDEKATCPTIEKFLSEILSEENVKIVQEWLGYCLLKQYIFKKAIIFVGERNTGKTTLVNLLKALIGEGNYSTIPLQRFAFDKFATSPLVNKYLNIVDDLGFKDLTDCGMFKMLTGNSPIPAEKKFGDPFNFTNYAKLTYSCNKIPQVKDVDDEAYFDRWIVVAFDKQVEKPDKRLIEKLTTPKELSGLLNYALTGLKRLEKNQDFGYTIEPEEIKKQMLKSSPVGAFSYDWLEQDDGNWVSKEEMFQSFTDYCHKFGLVPQSKEKLGRELPKSCNYMRSGKQGNTTGWYNVRIIADSGDTEKSAKSLLEM